MTPERAAALDHMLEELGWQDATIRSLAGDASNRRYLRLTRGAGRLVLMDAPAEGGEDVRPFWAMTDWLRGHGFSAPRVVAGDAENGLLLLEDLGDRLFARYAQSRPREEGALYERAVDLLVRLSTIPPVERIEGSGATHDVPAYDAETLRREALLATEWWVPAATGTQDGRGEELAGLIDEQLAAIAVDHSIMTLRDYHAENLIWLPEREGDAAVGLLDYQDVLRGHPAYDLVSLLEDARRDTSPELREAMVARYLAARPKLDGEAFRTAYALLGAQRNLKIVGIFARLALRDRKAQYLTFVPRVWKHLEGDLAHPAAAALGDWVRRHVPAPETDVLRRLAATVRP